MTDVAAALAEGARLFDEGRHWHAHEAWEEAWHALKREGRAAQADLVQGLILIAAAFENRARGKEAGFKRQMAEGLHRARRYRGEGHALGFVALAAWTDRVVDLYLDACRELAWERWRASDATVPSIREAMGARA